MLCCVNLLINLIAKIYFTEFCVNCVAGIVFLIVLLFYGCVYCIFLLKLFNFKLQKQNKYKCIAANLDTYTYKQNWQHTIVFVTNYCSFEKIALIIAMVTVLHEVIYRLNQSLSLLKMVK